MPDSEAAPDKTSPPERRALLETGVLALAGGVLGGLLAATGCSGQVGGKTVLPGAPPAAAGAGQPGLPDLGPAGSVLAAGSGAPTPIQAGDAAPLNELLRAEYSAITAYSAGAGLIMNAPATDPLYALRDLLGAVADDFQAQHVLHAGALVAAISALGASPVDQASIAASFTPPPALLAVPSIRNVLKFAATAERAAAVAYNRTLAGMADARLRQLASAIEGDESQHFMVLTALVLGLAAPGPKLSAARAGDLVPEAFVSSLGALNGLDRSPPDYFR